MLRIFFPVSILYVTMQHPAGTKLAMYPLPETTLCPRIRLKLKHQMKI